MRLAVVLLTVVLVWLPDAMAAAPPYTIFNQGQNGDAETGDTSGWTSDAWTARRYGDPAAYPVLDVSWNYMFASAVAGSAMTQVVSLAEDADLIDAGTADLNVSALLGGTGAQDAGAQVIVQPLDASGNVLGTPTYLAPPSAADRFDQAQLLRCVSPLGLPVGTRSVALIVRATSATDVGNLALADTIKIENYLSTIAFGYYPLPVPASNPQCQRLQRPVPTLSPTPAPSPAYPVALQISRVRLQRHGVSFTVNRATSVRVRIERRAPGGRWFPQRSRRLTSGHAGPVRTRFRRVPQGTFRVTITAEGRTLYRRRIRLR